MQPPCPARPRLECQDQKADIPRCLGKGPRQESMASWSFFRHKGHLFPRHRHLESADLGTRYSVTSQYPQYLSGAAPMVKRRHPPRSAPLRGCFYRTSRSDTAKCWRRTHHGFRSVPGPPEWPLLGDPQRLALESAPSGISRCASSSGYLGTTSWFSFSPVQSPAHLPQHPTQKQHRQKHHIPLMDKAGQEI